MSPPPGFAAAPEAPPCSLGLLSASQAALDPGLLASVASVHPIDAPLIHGAPPGTPNCTLGPLSASQAGLLSPHDADYQDFLIKELLAFM